SIAMMASVLMPLTVMGQQKSLKDQLVGTWIYVSSTAKRDDGSYEPRTQLAGRRDVHRRWSIPLHSDAHRCAELCVARPCPPFPGRGYGHRPVSARLHGHVYGGRRHKDDPCEYRDEHVSKSCRSSQSAAHRYVHHRRRNEVHESPHVCRPDAGDRVEAGEVVSAQDEVSTAKRFCAKDVLRPLSIARIKAVASAPAAFRVRVWVIYGRGRKATAGAHLAGAC